MGTESIKQSASYAEIPDETLSIYLTFLATEKFFLLHEHFPGTTVEDVDGTKDVEEMKRIVEETLKTLEGGEIEEELINVIKEV